MWLMLKEPGWKQKTCPKFSDGSNVIFVKDNDLTSYE